MAVQYSIQKMVSDGTLSTIALGIQYLQRNDIYMRIAGEETSQSGAPSGYTWSFINNTTLKILPIVPNGVEVVVYRRTDIDAMYNIYSQNAQFDEATIDENNQQLLYIAQEYLEQGIPGAGVDTLEFVRDDGTYTYYRIKRTDGSYSDEFAVPSAGSATKIFAREALRRSYAEAGYNLVDGSFEAGGTVTTATDVLLFEADGKAYSYTGTLPHTVDEDSSPSAEPGMWVDRSSNILRASLALSDGAKLIGACPDIATLRTIEPTSDKQRIPVVGYYINTPLKGGGDFVADFSDMSSADNGVTIIVTTGGKRWKRKWNLLRLAVECAGMGTARAPAENSDGWERLMAAIPQTGGTVILDGFYQIKYGVIVPPRVTVIGPGMDAGGFIKAGNDIKTVPDRLWQGIPRSYTKDFILAIDLDSDTSGNLDGNQTRATGLDGFSLLCTSGTKNAYGIYGTISYNVSIGDVFVKNVTTMLETDDSWLWNVKTLMGQDVVNGFVVKTGGTSFNLEDVYVRNATGVAFNFTNITYSNMTTCAADFVTGTAYKFKDCTGVNLDGCGAESITGKVLNIEGSRVSFSALRGVGIASDGGAGVIIKDSAVSMRASFLPDFSNGTANKYLSIDNATLNLDNAIIPDHTGNRILWGAGQSTINISQYNGAFTVYGNSLWVVLGTLSSGLLTVINNVPPDSSVNYLPVGSRWLMQTPAAGAIHTYVYVGGGVWKPAGSVAA